MPASADDLPVAVDDLQQHAARFNAPAALDVLVENRVTSLCAPPTVWRMLMQQDLNIVDQHAPALAELQQGLGPPPPDAAGGRS